MRFIFTGLVIVFALQSRVGAQSITTPADSARPEREAWFRTRVDGNTWRPILIGDSSAVSYAPEQTVRSANGRYVTMLRWDYRYEHSEQGAGPVSFVLKQEEVSCAEPRLRVLLGVYYRDNYVVDARRDSNPRWVNAAPGSADEQIANVICRAGNAATGGD